MSKATRRATAAKKAAKAAAKVIPTTPTAEKEVATDLEMTPDAEMAEVNLNDMTIIHQVAAGLDIHKEVIVASVVGLKDVPDGCETKKFGTFKKNLEELAKWLLDREVELVIMESTGVYWNRPLRVLQDAGVNVVLCNAREIKNVPGRKTDIEDSRWMANIARFGLYRSCRILPRDMEEVREIARQRQNLVEEQAKHKNRIHKLLVRAGFNLDQVVSDIFGVTGMIVIRELLVGLAPAEILSQIIGTVGYRLKVSKSKLQDALAGEMTANLKFEIEEELKLVDILGEKISTYERRLKSELLAKGYEKELQLLGTIPGIGEVGAMIILAELGGDVSDFRSAAALASWAGMCPGNNESAGKRKSGRTTHGDSHLKRLFCETAWAASRTECYFRHKWKALKPRLRFKKAIVAIGHKMLKVVYHILSCFEPYKDPSVDLTELMVKKNAPRWIRNLKAYGMIS
jgi:transposase